MCVCVCVQCNTSIRMLIWNWKRNIFCFSLVIDSYCTMSIFVFHCWLPLILYAISTSLYIDVLRQMAHLQLNFWSFVVKEEKKMLLFVRSSGTFPKIVLLRIEWRGKMRISQTHAHTEAHIGHSTEHETETSVR